MTKNIEQLAQKVAGIKTQITELEQQLDEIDYVEYGAYPIGTVVRLKDSGKIGWVKEIKLRNWSGFQFFYEVGPCLEDRTPVKVGVIEYWAVHENLEVIEDEA